MGIETRGIWLGISAGWARPMRLNFPMGIETLGLGPLRDRADLGSNETQLPNGN